jgi:alkylation response protein AidB-like acyl-CoA dehydrogenase
MNLEWTAEQEELRANVRRFLAEQGTGAKLSGLGLFGLLVPEALGGAGLGMLELGVVLEEAGRALHAGPFLASALGATRLLLAAATPAEQRELLPALATGERRAAVVGLAPGAAFHAHGGRLSGAEPFALEAGGADLLLVAADGALFAADPASAGVRIEPAETLDLTRRFDRVALDAAPARRLGAGDARAALAAAADALAVGLVADGVGAAARALERAVEYAKQREQFERPIGSFQAVQHLLVDMLQDVELTRAAAAFALWAQDAAPAAERARASALAKAFASEALPRVGASAIQVFGGIGFSFELDLHRYYRRLLSLSLLHGDAAHHLERIAEAAFTRDERS